MTVGRSGSTALMNYLGKFTDIALPCKDVDCVDNELLHPRMAAQYADTYARLCSFPVRTRDELIECFYRHHAASAYAGFKSMPNRHPDFEVFCLRPDIRFMASIWRASAGAVGVRSGTRQPACAR